VLSLLHQLLKNHHCNWLHCVRPVAHDPSSLSKLLVPESCTSNFANLSCILVPDLSGTGTRNLDRLEHVYCFHVSGTKFAFRISDIMNLDGKLGLCVMGLRHSLEHSNPRTLTFRAERQSVRMSKITIDGLTGSGTGCFIASCASTHMTTVAV